MSQLNALIFDVDGTLAETERDAHLPAFNDTFAGNGLDWHWSAELYGKLLQVAGGKERMKYYLNKHRPDIPPPDDVDTRLARLHTEKTARYNDLVRTGRVALRPGVERLLREAREAGVRLAVATTTSLQNVYTLLECNLGADAPEWFEVIGAGDMVAEKKPAPDIYHYVLEKLQLPAENCLALEDSANGLRAARDSGLACVITPAYYTKGENFSGALAVFENLDESGNGERVDLSLLQHLLN